MYKITLNPTDDSGYGFRRRTRSVCRAVATGVLWLLAVSAGMAAELPSLIGGKLDRGIDGDQTTMLPVFVRMSDQLLPRGGDYEAFARDHQNDRRSQLRRYVLRSLREKERRSWEHAAGLVEELTRSRQVREVERFWIVNGFACDATAAACRRLAELEAVSFVYLQRGPVRQHKSPITGTPGGSRGPSPQQQRQIYKQVVSAWRGDTDEAFSAEGLQIPWNLTRIQAPAAWSEEGATGKGVVIALCDSGLMVAPPLVSALWRNEGEKLNGADDDNNGYVDDLFGYDFAARSFYALGDRSLMPHGSMCGGIIAGRPSKGKVITGIAPRARLMVLRGMGYLRAYEYALVNGADIMSMSYMWVNMELGHYRGLYRTAHEHLAAGGIVAVGGAGNFARLPKGRQIALPKDVPCVIAAAGILEDGSKAPPGSEGPCYWNGVKFYDDYPPDAPLMKPDVTGCFGGYPVWGRTIRFARGIRIVSDEGNGFALVVGPQGNSFSGPHAAGVAALMLSVNPELNPWQVKRLMEETCKELGAPSRDPVFGAGLLQAREAVRAAKKVVK